MLGVDDATEMNEQLWAELPSRVVLPEEVANSLRGSAHDYVPPDCQRRYARKPLSSIAIVVAGEARHACCTKDVSRLGLGLYSPVNFLPKQLVQLWLPNGNTFGLRVVRSRRLAERCYEVGTRFYAVDEKQG